MKHIPVPLALLWLLFASGCSNNPSNKPAAASETMLAATPPPYFIHLSDIHLDSYSQNTYYGTDTGMDLWNITYQKLDSILGSATPPQFVVYTGDLPAHNTTQGATQSDCNGESGKTQTSAHLVNVKTLVGSIFALFKKYPDIPFFYLPGNNDGLRCDYCSFDDVQQGIFLTQMAQDSLPAIHADANCGNPPCIVDSQISAGYYSALAMPGLRLILLNSVIFGKKYIERDSICQLDAGNRQMTWLRGQLASASKNGEKVYLAMHIPPGMDAHSGHPTWANISGQTPWLNQFLGMVDSNQSTISGILYGHTHMDELRRLYNLSQTQITEIAISAPGISPVDGNNPGFKLVYFDPASKELLDFVTCYTTPGSTVFGDATYRFSSTFGFQPGPGKFIADSLKNMPLQTIDQAMNTIYLVKRKTASSKSTMSGIEVVPVQ